MSKGQINMGLNWVYVAIVGGLIILLAIIIVSNIQSESEKDIINNIKNELRNFFTTAGTTEKTLFKMTMPSKPLYYTDCSTGITVGSFGGPAVDENMKNVFLPNIVKSEIGHIWLWTIDWDVPYHTENFVFMASPEVVYIIVDDGNYAYDLLDDPVHKIPDNITRIKTDNLFNLNFNEMQMIEGAYQVNIISFDNDFSVPLDINKAVEKVYKTRFYEINHGLDGYGKVEFGEWSGSSWINEGVSDFFGRAMAYGAIFSDDLEHYECGLKYGLEKLKGVTEVYQKRMEKIYEDLGDDECIWYIALRTTGGNALEDLDNYLSQLETGDVEDYYTYSTSVSQTNDELELQGCPKIY
ncbi:hypothetical protein ACFL1H_00240 [Nanoarchaeota archaeon]